MAKNIVLVDAAGMSISLLAAKMNQAAEAEGLDYHTVGIGDANAQSQIEADNPVVIMIAPQVKYMHAKYEEAYGATYPVVDINMVDYGMMRGSEILHAAIEAARD